MCVYVCVRTYVAMYVCMSFISTATLCSLNIEISGSFYAGTKSTVPGSVSEVPCQRFDSQYPHDHSKWNIYPYYFNVESVSEVNNYCRDPDNGGYPWCYTTDVNKRWAYCDIPMCEPGMKRSTFLNCACCLSLFSNCE